MSRAREKLHGDWYGLEAERAQRGPRGLKRAALLLLLVTAAAIEVMK